MKISAPHAALPTGERRGGTTSTNLLGVSTIGFAIVLALVGTGTTYALLSSAAPLEGATISAGSTSITVNGGTAAQLTPELALLAPGESTVAQVTVANTGTTPVSVFVSSSTLDSQTRGLADFLELGFTRAETCKASEPGASAASIEGFTTAPERLETGASADYCLEIFLAADAPASVQGGTVAFTLLLDANQVPR